MLRIAHQNGSAEFERPLRRLGLPVAVVTTLKFGDFAFTGNGPDGPCPVLIERKTITEMTGLASFNRFRRHQLPGLVKDSAGGFRFVIVEGLTKVDKWGVLMAAKDIKDGRMSVWFDAGWNQTNLYEVYRKREMTTRLRGGVHLLNTANDVETAHLIAAVYRWFTQKSWAEHGSHLQVDEVEPDRAILDERTATRQVFAQFPHVGWKRSARVSRYFGCVADGCAGTVEEWQRALGVKKGEVMARAIVAFLHGKSDRLAKG